MPIANIGALPGGPRYVDDDTWTSALEIIQDSTAASAMHSCLCFIGLNTGEVVTFELSFQKHKYEVSGVTIKKVTCLNFVLFLYHTVFDGFDSSTRQDATPPPLPEVENLLIHTCFM